MNMNSKSLKLSGIVPPLVTPLLDESHLDVKGLEKVINHVIAGGVSGVFVLGTTGELARLSSEIRKEVIEETCRIVNKRVPVLIGITDPSMQETLKLEKLACQFGADAVVLAPPFYYHVEQNELLDYYNEVAKSISLPMYMYNMPSRTHINISIDTVMKATKIPGIIGLKDSSGDLFYFQKLLFLLKDKPEFTVFVGPEEILSQCVLLGASGGVNGGANIYPELFVNLYEASVKRDVDAINKLQDEVTKISSTLYQVGKGNFIKIIKEALHQKGFCEPYMAKPYLPYSEEEKNQISNCLSNCYNNLINAKH